MTKKVLLVDDEPNVLQGYKRHLRKNYELELAVGGQAALELIESQGPFAVVVTDMQMPEISGLELLSRIYEINDSTVRIMLTGNADQRTAVDAVNEGNIFRFLNKPCSPEQLAIAIDAGIEQYRLVTAEHDLLSKTLSGSIKMLSQVLSLAMPEAFGMAQETRRLVRILTEELGAGQQWQLEIAAMLMRIGCVSLPKEILTKYIHGQELDEDEQLLVKETPELGSKMVASIPRLDSVAELIRLHQTTDSKAPLAARILATVGDYQRYSASSSPFAVIDKMLSSPAYDRVVVEALEKVVCDYSETRQVTIGELAEGMIFEEHVENLAGHILISGGTEVHETMIQKLKSLRRTNVGVREPIVVRMLNPRLAKLEKEPQPKELASAQ